MQAKSKSRKRGSRRRGARGGGGPLLPPPFVPTIHFTHKFRFANGTHSGTFTILRSNLLNLLQLSDSTLSSWRLIDAIRLKKVEVWANPVALGSAPTTVSVEWLGENSPSTIVSDTSMGVRPAHVSTVPPPSSSNRWWSITGSLETDDIFVLVLPADCVIDVSVDIRLFDLQTVGTAGDITNTESTFLGGALEFDFLDGTASGKLTPVGSVNIPT